MINPLVVSFVNEEKKFFSAVTDLFKKFDGLNAKMQSMDRQLKKTVNNYDPAKYVRGHKLLNGVNFSNVSFEKGEIKNNNNSKFTYNDYLNKKNTGTTTNTNVNNTQQNDNKYSYDQYKNKNNTNVGDNFFTQNNVENSFSGFSDFDNNFSKQTKGYNNDIQFDFMNNSVNNVNNMNNLNNSLKKTTVVPQHDNYSSSYQHDQQVDNPYGQIDLDGNTSKSGFAQNFVSKSQFPSSSNQPYTGSSFNYNTGNTGGFPNLSEINRGGGNGNLSFPKK